MGVTRASAANLGVILPLLALPVIPAKAGIQIGEVKPAT